MMKNPPKPRESKLVVSVKKEMDEPRVTESVSRELADRAVGKTRCTKNSAMLRIRKSEAKSF